MGATTPTTFPRRRDFAFTPVSSTRAVPLSVTLLRANPALNTALKQFETSQVKFETAFVTPWASSSSSPPPESPAGLAEPWRRRASLYSQDEEDDIDDDEDTYSDWGDDEYSEDGDVDEAEEDGGYFGVEDWKRNLAEQEENRAIWERRGRQRSRPALNERQVSPSRSPLRSAPQLALTSDDRDAFVAQTPPLLPSFKLKLPENRRRVSDLAPAVASSSIPESHFSADSSTSSSSSDSSNFSESSLTLYSPTDDTAVDVEASWERAMRFSGWIRRSDLPAASPDGASCDDCFVPITEASTETEKWEFKGRKGTGKVGRQAAAVEGLRRLVEMVQS